MNIAIVGAGYVGLVTGLCLADRKHQVICVDLDAGRIAQLNRGVLPLHEPGLDELLGRCLGKHFFPSTDLADAVRRSDATLITVGTPLENDAISLRYVENAAAGIGKCLSSVARYHVVVVKSTVVPGTTEECVRPILESTSAKKCGVDFGLGMNPEFLREGEAVNDFQTPDRIVLGAIDERSFETMAGIYAAFKDAVVIRTNVRTAEMIKYASNALFATLISFSNEIGNFCAVEPGVDAVDVMSALHSDRRITTTAADGSRVVPALTSYLKAGCGFGGSCFPKDVRALIEWGSRRDRPARVLSAVLETNEKQPAEVLGLLKKHFPDLHGLRVAVLGLAFKPGTDDLRESPSLRVIARLLAEGAKVIAYDPVAAGPARVMIDSANVSYATSLAEATVNVDAVLLLTAWPEFEELPALLTESANPPVVVDGRRMLDKTRMRRYEGIGLGSAQPAEVPLAASAAMLTPTVPARVDPAV